MVAMFIDPFELPAVLRGRKGILVDIFGLKLIFEVFRASILVIRHG